MSLKDAVKLVVQGMREDVEGVEDSKESRLVMGYIRSLEIALASASDEPKPLQPGPKPSHLLMLEQMEQQEAAAQVRREDRGAGFALCVGGESDGMMVPCNAEIPKGANTIIEEDVYTWSGQSWHHNAAATATYRASKKTR